MFVRDIGLQFSFRVLFSLPLAFWTCPRVWISHAGSCADAKLLAAPWEGQQSLLANIHTNDWGDRTFWHWPSAESLDVFSPLTLSTKCCECHHLPPWYRWGPVPGRSMDMASPRTDVFDDIWVSHECAMDWVFMSSCKSMCWNSNSQGDGRWGLWGVLRTWRGSPQEQGYKRILRNFLAASVKRRHSAGTAVNEPGSGLSSGTESAGDLILDFNLQNLKHFCCFKPQNLWCSVVVARMD